MMAAAAWICAHVLRHENVGLDGATQQTKPEKTK
jgi:hypothetical protein